MLKHNRKIITKHVVCCDNIFSQGTGLIFRSEKVLENTAWIFPFKNSARIGVTMMFVFYPIDILFLDDKNRIIEIKENLKPFSNYISRLKAKSFIELKRGVIHRHALHVGDKLTITL